MACNSCTLTAAFADTQVSEINQEDAQIKMKHLKWGKVLALVKKEEWDTLIAGDQLKNEIAGGRALHGFEEAKIAFAPTFKLARHELQMVVRYYSFFTFVVIVV